MNDALNDSFRFCQGDAAAEDPTNETPSSRPDSATPKEDGTQGTVTLDELFFILSNGALGVEPKRAQPPTTTTTPKARA